MGFYGTPGVAVGIMKQKMQKMEVIILKLLSKEKLTEEEQELVDKIKENYE